MAALSADGYDRAESYGQHVRAQGWYDEWAGPTEQDVARAYTGLRTALAELDKALDAATAYLLDAEHPVTTGPARDESLPVAFEERAAHDDWPGHQPDAPEAPIPGRHWYSGCDPDRPRVNPSTRRCEGCGETACGLCGRENCPDHDDLAA